MHSYLEFASTRLLIHVFWLFLIIVFRCKAVFITSVAMLGDKKFDNLSDQRLMLNASSSET